MAPLWRRRMRHPRRPAPRRQRRPIRPPSPLLGTRRTRGPRRADGRPRRTTRTAPPPVPRPTPLGTRPARPPGIRPPPLRARLAVPDLGLPRLRLPGNPRPGSRRRQLAVRHHRLRRGGCPSGRAADGPVEVGIQRSQVTHRPDPGHSRSRGPALRRARCVRRHAGRFVQQRHEHGGPAPVGRRQVRASERHRRGDRRVASAPRWSPLRSTARRARAPAPASSSATTATS